MKQIISGFIILLFLAGCSTTGGSVKSLENRVQALEMRVQAVESGVEPAGMESSTVAISETGALTAQKDQITVESITKKQIQEALKNAGYYDGEVDGKFGSKTKTAVMEFQKNMGLKVDGVAGRNTKEKLLKYL